MIITRHVFGDYSDIYDIRQSVADCATLPIYYEPRIVKLTIDEAGAKAAEAKIAEYATRTENTILRSATPGSRTVFACLR